MRSIPYVRYFAYVTLKVVLKTKNVAKGVTGFLLLMGTQFLKRRDVFWYDKSWQK